jgi:hypothetical protein
MVAVAADNRGGQLPKQDRLMLKNEAGLALGTLLRTYNCRLPCN